MPRPQDAAAAQEKRHHVFAKPIFVCGVPSRWCAAQKSGALPAGFVVSDGGLEIAVDLLEAHLVEVLFVAFCRRARSWFIGPEPVEDQAVLGNQAIDLLSRQPTGSGISPPV